MLLDSDQSKLFDKSNKLSFLLNLQNVNSNPTNEDLDKTMDNISSKQRKSKVDEMLIQNFKQKKNKTSLNLTAKTFFKKIHYNSL